MSPNMRRLFEHNVATAETTQTGDVIRRFYRIAELLLIWEPMEFLPTTPGFSEVQCVGDVLILVSRVGGATASHVYPSMIGRSTPRPSVKSHSAGAGVPTGRVRRASLAAILGSSMSHAAWRRSSTRKVAAVAAP
jgi:hypothetical protein